MLEYYKEYHTISTDINKIMKFHIVQSLLFDTDNLDENDLYAKLNKLIGYNPIGAKKEML